MRALTSSFCIGAAVLLLAGCNQAQPVASAPPPPAVPAAAKFAYLPARQACTKKILELSEGAVGRSGERQC